MRPQINRLPASAPKGFHGSEIDRNRPLRFLLDGRQISGFSGDNLLSAVLASGIDTLGRRDDQPIGLTTGSAPMVSLSDSRGQAFSMASCPAIDGIELVTTGAHRHNPLARLFLPGRTLGLDLDDANILAKPWLGQPALQQTQTDLVVIGGGVAGMAAALAAARSGLKVVLFEGSAVLGGHSGLFGTQDGEEAPETQMQALRKQVADHDAIETYLNAEAFAIGRGLVRVHQLDVVDRKPRALVHDISARYNIIATGSRERLPIFAGNRLPGIVGTLDAYLLATRYSVWPGQSALVATGSNFSYRLAMLASDAGIAVNRILDARPRPSSRFIEFSRAYGMVQITGTPPKAAAIGKAGGQLSISTDAAHPAPFIADRFLVCGGWQPDLTLWHAAGGTSRWSADRHRLEPAGTLDNIALAGSAAGYLTRQGCVASGQDAVDSLLARPRKPINDPAIDPSYESPDAPVCAEPHDGENIAYLDSGSDFLERPQAAPKRWMDRWQKSRSHDDLWTVFNSPQPLTICDVSAAVDLGLVPADAAGVVAQERVALVPLSAAPDLVEAPEFSLDPAAVPTYLRGRFGSDEQVVTVTPLEERRLETGALIFRSSDQTQPLRAVGVVLRPLDKGALALIAGPAIRLGLPVSVREQGRVVSARIEPPKS